MKSFCPYSQSAGRPLQILNPNPLFFLKHIYTLLPLLSQSVFFPLFIDAASTSRQLS